MSLLSATALTRRFGGLIAVNQADLNVEEGEVRALIGPNGAGKSTLVGMLCGRITATSGSVRFLNRDITHWPSHRRATLGIAYTFQITSIFERLSLHENVALGVRRVLGKDGKRVESATMDALAKVGLADRAAELAGDLSYGHQRLLEIAMGLGQKPRLLILDEPTQGLAASEIDSFNDLIRTMAGETTILLIEHNMDVVMELADRITVLNNGEVLAEGSPAEIQDNVQVQSAYLGTG